MLSNNPILDTDSYKLSHWNQYPPGTTEMMSYFESRGGEFEECTLFGLQYALDQYLTTRITLDMVREAEAFALDHGEPFNVAGWTRIACELEGKLPVRIRAVPEGTVVPVRNALLTIESTDPATFWVVSWLETMLVRLWYPSTIAIASRESKRVLKRFLDLSSDHPEAEIGFKLHDFGGRGVTSQEQARLGGAAHLLSFFGSDTIEGIRMANEHYACAMAGFSIPATEHSAMTMWGEKKEREVFAAYVDTYLTKREAPTGVPKRAACVSDSFDIYRACGYWTEPEMLEKLKASGGTLVIRPDSGDPLQVLPAVFDILNDRAGMTDNSKGYAVLPPYLRVIQGDGINRESMTAILQLLTDMGISASNIAFGSGGGLLQQVNRDTQQYAFKCCHARVSGTSVDVRKNPVTDEGKRSKAGRLDLVKRDGKFQTVSLYGDQRESADSAMRTVFENGEILERTTFDECRARIVL